jgi:hypothetical protein
LPSDIPVFIAATLLDTCHRFDVRHCFRRVRVVEAMPGDFDKTFRAVNHSVRRHQI